eukprot:g874.t1
MQGASQDESAGNSSGPSFSDPSDRSTFEVEEPLLMNGSNSRASALREYFQSFESLNYEFDPSGLDVEPTRDEAYFRTLFRSAIKWTLCLILGAATAVIAFSVNVGVENIAGFKFWATLQVMKSGSMFPSYLIYTTMNCLLVWFASAIVVYYAPAAAGSGIPDVKSFLNGVDVPRVLHPTTLVAKVAGSVGAVSASLAVGKEGPFVHTGACLAFILSQGRRVSRVLSPQIFNMFTTDRQLRDFVTCGAAAGVAAAFRAPVGGVLFALEEAASWWRNQILWLAFFTTAIVSIILRAMINYCSPKTSTCGFFGAGDFILFNISDGQEEYELFELLPMLLLGVLGGLLGSAFNALNAQLTIWRKSFFRTQHPKMKVFEAVAVAFLTSTIAFCLPMTVSCQRCPYDASDVCPRAESQHSGNYVSFNCPEGPYHNDLATLFFNTQDESIRSLLSTNNNMEYTERSLLLYFVFFYILAILTYGVSIPSGLFVPCILCGSSYGRLVGMYVNGLHPNGSIDEGTYALLGAAGFLAGSTRMTVSLCVIILELTNNLALLPLIMLVLLVAKGVGDGLGIKAIYDLHVDLKGVPFLETKPERFMQYITAKEMCSKPPIQFRRHEKVNYIWQILQCTTHNAFPVIGRVDHGEEKVLGTILRSSLEDLLMREGPDGMESGEEEESRVHNLQGTSVEHDEEILDLQKMLNKELYTVDETMAASKVYSLFRQLGLRHLYVVQRPCQVIGMITRKDLLPELLHAKFHSRAEASQLLTTTSRPSHPENHRIESHHSIRQGQMNPASSSGVDKKD